MAFYLYHHYRLDNLAELLAVLLERKQPKNPLQSQTVIVPNQGVARWLQVQLAEDAGIAANIEMPLPASFIWKTIPKALGDDAGSAAFERQQVRWHLFELLPKLCKSLPQIEHYLDSEDVPLQSFQLAEKLADVFDQYLVFRPQMLKAWERGASGDSPMEQWQSEVWRQLKRHLAPRRHRAELLASFVAQCETNQRSLHEPPLFCFGLGNLPPDFLRFFYALAKQRELHFLMLNPCGEYWADLQNRTLSLACDPALPDNPTEDSLHARHPLLASLGRPTRDLLRLLYSDELQQIIEPDLGQALNYEAPQAGHLLARVQTGVLKMQAGDELGAPADSDSSIQVHACHGPLREIQVLHDQLLDLLAGDPDLRPRDILVMMPNVQAYSAAIQAVFGAAQGDLHIPWSLSDRGLANSHPILNSFLQLLDLPISRWRLSEILKLAAVPAVMRRFDLDESTLSNLHSNLHDAGARWGLNAQTRHDFQAADSNLHTWEFALDRMLLGTIQSDQDTLFEGLNPWTQLEGGAAQPLGKLIELLNQLVTWSQALQTPANPALWMERILGFVSDIFEPASDDHAEQAAMHALQTALSSLESAAQCLGERSELSWSCVRKLLRDELARGGQAQAFMSDGVNFCGLLPLRSVPFRVVCLLGMDDGAFPRQDEAAGFNLLRSHPKLGDLKLRDEDRLLFLQAIMAASDVFYISYTGQDPASGDAQAPAPLVSEWLEFLRQYYCPALAEEAFSQRFVTQQSLQVFSPKLYSKTPKQARLFSFREAWRTASRQKASSAMHWLDAASLDSEHHPLIELAELKKFYRHPQKFFQQQRMQIHRLDARQQAQDDEEPLQLDGLQRHKLSSLMLARHADGDIPDTPTAWWASSGLLPAPPLDQASWQTAREPVQALLPIWQQWLQQQRRDDGLEVDLNLPSAQLRGRLTGLWATGPRYLQLGTIRLRHKLQASLDALCFHATVDAADSRLLGLGKNETPEQWRCSLSGAQAQEQLERLLQFFLHGSCQAVLFHPDLAQQFCELRDKAATDDEALRKLNSRLNDSFMPHHLRSDPWFAATLPADKDLGDQVDGNEFIHHCEQITALVNACWEPLA